MTLFMDIAQGGTDPVMSHSFWLDVGDTSSCANCGKLAMSPTIVSPAVPFRFFIHAAMNTAHVSSRPSSQFVATQVTMVCSNLMPAVV